MKKFYGNLYLIMLMMVFLFCFGCSNEAKPLTIDKILGAGVLEMSVQGSDGRVITYIVEYNEDDSINKYTCIYDYSKRIEIAEREKDAIVENRKFLGIKDFDMKVTLDGAKVKVENQGEVIKKGYGNSYTKYKMITMFETKGDKIIYWKYKKSN